MFSAVYNLDFDVNLNYKCKNYQLSAKYPESDLIVEIGMRFQNQLLLMSLILMGTVLVTTDSLSAVQSAISLRNGVHDILSGRNAEAFAALHGPALTKQNNILARRLLARHYMEIGQPFKALDHLKFALAAMPTSISVLLENAQALNAAGRISEANDIRLQLGKQIAVAAGQSQEVLTSLGEKFFDEKEYAIALEIHRRLLELDPIHDLAWQFRSAVLAILSHNAKVNSLLLTYRELDRTFQVYDLGSELTIAGSQFRRISPPSMAGQPLINPVGGDTGSFNMVPGEAVALVSVPITASYHIVASVDGSPLPVKMAIGVNHEKLQNFELMPDDGGWREVGGKAVTLNKGLNIVNIWFLPYEQNGQTQRFAELAWIKLTKND